MKPRIFKAFDGYYVEQGDAYVEIDDDGTVSGGGLLEEPRNGEGISIDDVPQVVAAEILKVTGWKVPRPTRELVSALTIQT